VVIQPFLLPKILLKLLRLKFLNLLKLQAKVKLLRLKA
jgi:hypothetical protein